ncbi:hypothetical protein [Caulobacter sp. RHG1]|nr:hypothetical protein [Caulobacter sp. RHG1]NQE62940.1 hypothetical protein [Caulobacter sp. RHG1]
MIRFFRDLLNACRDVLARHADAGAKIVAARQEIEDGARPKARRFKL